MEGNRVHFVRENGAGEENMVDTKLLAVSPIKQGNHWWAFSPLQGTFVTTVRDRLMICRLVQ